jgi:hypothetical protein
MNTQKYAQQFVNAARALVQGKVERQTTFLPNGEKKLDFGIENKYFTAVQPTRVTPLTMKDTAEDTNQQIVLIHEQNKPENILGHCDLTTNAWVGYDSVSPVDIREIEKALGASAGG